MKKMLRALAIAALAISAPVAAHAQQTIDVTITAWPIDAGPNGGQFKAQTTLGDLLVYCIDPLRNIAGIGVTAKYRVYTFAQYIDVINVSLPASFTPSRSLNDINTMAANALGINANGVGAISNGLQQNTWAIFRGDANGVAQSNISPDWRVLISEEALRSPQGVAGFQTFITTVPEPSTYLLMAVGLGSILVVSRRRRNV